MGNQIKKLTKNPGLFYREKPLFGLDFGHSNIKVMQMESGKEANPKVMGYGVINYPAQAINNGGIIVDFNVLQKALFDLFSEHIVGTIDTHRVACTVPSSKTFSRPMKLPVMDHKDIAQAVHLEAEQYIPVPPDSLYIDYEIINHTNDGIDLLMVASPRNIIDSYVQLLLSVGLEPVALEPTMNAATRLFGAADPSHNEPSVLVDFGSVAVDLAVFDQTMFVNSTVPGGSDTISQVISHYLGVSTEESYKLKNQHGIAKGPHKDEIMKAVKPTLDNLVREIQKVIRYYDDRQSKQGRKIIQIVMIGGGANMPGLSEYLSQEMHLPTRRLEPWKKISFGDLEPPNEIDRSMYITVAGEALLNPEEVFP